MRTYLLTDEEHITFHIHLREDVNFIMKVLMKLCEQDELQTYQVLKARVERSLLGKEIINIDNKISKHFMFHPTTDKNISIYSNKRGRRRVGTE